MVGLIASRVTVVQYRLMLTFSLRDDPLMAQLILKNIVLLTAILEQFTKPCAVAIMSIDVTVALV